MKTRWAMIGAAALLLTACVPVVVPGQLRVDVPVPGVVIDPVDPYYYSPAYCGGGWDGERGGRIGYPPGGGGPGGGRALAGRHPRTATRGRSCRPRGPLQSGHIT